MSSLTEPSSDSNVDEVAAELLGSGEAPLLEEGTLIGGKYRVVAPVGRGGQGRVYRARHERLGACAIKFSLVVSDARVSAEGMAIAELRAAHIVPIIDLGEHEGRPYLVLDWVEGSHLSHALHRANAGRLAVQLLTALEYLHEQRVARHGDLKPSNLLVEPKSDGPHLVVIDLGLAGLTDRADGRPTGGTRGYMAPEQAAGRGGREADVWAAGVVIYELLTGRRPVDAHTRPDDPQPIAWGAVPWVYRRPLERALSWRPEDRPTARQLRMQMIRAEALATHWRSRLLAALGVAAASALLAVGVWAVALYTERADAHAAELAALTESEEAAISVREQVDRAWDALDAQRPAEAAVHFARVLEPGAATPLAPHVALRARLGAGLVLGRLPSEAAVLARLAPPVASLGAVERYAVAEDAGGVARIDLRSGELRRPVPSMADRLCSGVGLTRDGTVYLGLRGGDRAGADGAECLLHAFRVGESELRPVTIDRDGVRYRDASPASLAYDAELDRLALWLGDERVRLLDPENLEATHVANLTRTPRGWTLPPRRAVADRVRLRFFSRHRTLRAEIEPRTFGIPQVSDTLSPLSPPRARPATTVTWSLEPRGEICSTVLGALRRLSGAQNIVVDARCEAPRFSPLASEDGRVTYVRAGQGGPGGRATAAILRVIHEDGTYAELAAPAAVEGIAIADRDVLLATEDGTLHQYQLAPDAAGWGENHRDVVGYTPQWLVFSARGLEVDGAPPLECCPATRAHARLRASLDAVASDVRAALPNDVEEPTISTAVRAAHATRGLVGLDGRGRVVRSWDHAIDEGPYQAIFGCGEDATVVSGDEVWRLSPTAEHALAPAPIARSASATPDCSMIAVVDVDRRLRVFRDARLDRTLEGVDLAAVDPRGRFVVVARGTRLNLESAAAAMPSWEADAAAPVTALVVHPARELVVSGDAEGRVTFWSPDAAEPIARLDHGRPVTALGVSRDGQWLGVASEGGVVAHSLDALHDRRPDLVRRLRCAAGPATDEAAHAASGDASSSLTVAQRARCVR